MKVAQLACDICQEHFDSKEELLEHQRRIHSADVARRRSAAPGVGQVQGQEEDTAA